MVMPNEQMLDAEMQQEQQIAKSQIPAGIDYRESVEKNLNMNHNYEFRRREQTKLINLLENLPEDEKNRLDELI